MAKMVDFTFNKIENLSNFCRLNSFVYRELNYKTTIYNNYLRYLLIIFVIRKNNGFVEFHNSGEEFCREFEAADILVTYSFLGYLPYELSGNYTADNMAITTNKLHKSKVQQIKISQELCKLLEQTKYMGDNMLFNEKVFFTFSKTTEKWALEAFEQHLVNSCELRIKKSEIFTYFRREKIPKLFKF